MEPATLRRHQDRASYDIDALAAVFADCFIAHVSYVDDGLPQCLPMVALMRKENEHAVVYLHGHPSSRIMELVRKWETEREKEAEGAAESNGKVDAERIASSPVRVCITATKVDGLVLSSAPNGHTFNYRSAVVHGACSLERDRATKQQIMKDVTNHIVHDRWDDLNPVASFQVSLVTVIRVDVLSGSLKTRAGIPGIQPRNPEKDGPDREGPVWTGVVPLHDRLEEPVPSGLSDGAVVPDSLAAFIERRNEEQAQFAQKAAR